MLGQPMAVDPSRAPDGSWVIWVQLQELPPRPKGDAAGELDVGDGTWTEELREAYADRIVARIGRHIENLESRDRRRVVMSPADMEAANPNWVGGDIYAGSCALDQNLLFRPTPAHAGPRDAGRAALAHRREHPPRPRPRCRLRLPRREAADAGRRCARRAAREASRAVADALAERDLDRRRVVRRGRPRVRGGRLRRDRDLGDEARRRRGRPRGRCARAASRVTNCVPARAVDPPEHGDRGPGGRRGADRVDAARRCTGFAPSSRTASSA